MKRQRKRKPTKTKTAIKTQIIDNLRTGMTIKAAALLASISEKTFYNWRDADEVFLKQCEEAVRFAEAVMLERVKQLGLDNRRGRFTNNPLEDDSSNEAQVTWTVQAPTMDKALEDIYKAKIDKLEKELDSWAELVDDLNKRIDRHHKLIDHFLG